MNACAGNRLSLLETGDQFFPSLEAALTTAVQEVHLETYIFGDDETGRRLGVALARCAARGVNVRVLVDGFGSKDLAPNLRAILTPAGVQVLVYRPRPQGWSLYIHHLRRMHRKLVVIDGALAFCGGINLQNDRSAYCAAAPRYDFALKIEGPIVGDIHRAVRRLWQLVEMGALKRVTAPRLRWMPRSAPLPEDHLASFLTRDNLRYRRQIESAYLAAINCAENDIVIACGYFLPGRRIRHALLGAAQRGVRVRLLLQGQPDHLLVHYATHALYRTFLTAGIEVYEYRTAHLHAKVAVIDKAWATVGSSNIDPFSLWLSREANVVFFDQNLVATLRRSLGVAITDHAQPITPALAHLLPLRQRLQAWLAYELGRLLIGLAGFATRDEL